MTTSSGFLTWTCILRLPSTSEHQTVLVSLSFIEIAVISSLGEAIPFLLLLDIKR